MLAKKYLPGKTILSLTFKHLAPELILCVAARKCPISFILMYENFEKVTETDKGMLIRFRF